MVTDEEMQSIKATFHDPVIDGYYFDDLFTQTQLGTKRVSTKHGKFANEFLVGKRKNCEDKCRV